MSVLTLIGKTSGFGKGKLTRPKTDEVDGASQSQASQGGNEILRLKKRFMKDSEQSKLYFIKRATRLQDLREVRVYT